MHIFSRFETLKTKNADSTWAYVEGHLRNTKERPGPSHKDGFKPYMPNPDLWRQVGYDGDSKGPSKDLLTNLMAGCDASGEKLTASRKDCRPPKELIVATHAEVSHGLHLLGPRSMDFVLKKLTAATVQEVEQRAVRVMSQGESQWEAARCLFLTYPHHTNRIQDPHAHDHLLIYPPALCQDGKWRVFDNGACLRALSVDIRPVLTEVMISACADLGVKVTLNRALAGEEGRFPSGAEVVLPSGLIIPAGSLTRPRSAEIRADRELKANLGILPLTSRQLAWVLDSPGARPEDMPRPGDRAQFCRKVAELGLSDPTTGRLLEPVLLHQALHAVTRKMATAQVQLEAFRFLPGQRAGAAVLVAQKRTELCEAIGVQARHQRQEAADAWVEQAVEALGTLQGAPRQSNYSRLNAFEPNVKRLFHRHAQRAGLVRFERSKNGHDTKPVLRDSALAALDRLTFGLGQMVSGSRPVPHAIDANPEGRRVLGPGSEPRRSTAKPVEGPIQLREGLKPPIPSGPRGAPAYGDHEFQRTSDERHAGAPGVFTGRPGTAASPLAASGTRDSGDLGARMAARHPAKGLRPTPDQRVKVASRTEFPAHCSAGALPLPDFLPATSGSRLHGSQWCGPTVAPILHHRATHTSILSEAPGGRAGIPDQASYPYQGNFALDGGPFLPLAGPRSHREGHERSLRNVEAAFLHRGPMEPSRPSLPASDPDRAMRALRLGFNGIQLLKPTMKGRLTEWPDEAAERQRRQETGTSRSRRKKPGWHDPATSWELPRPEMIPAKTETTPSPQVQAQQPRLPGR